MYNFQIIQGKKKKNQEEKKEGNITDFFLNQCLCFYSEIE